MTHFEDDINTAEGTNFNLDFATLVLGNVIDDLTVIGDPVKTLGARGKHEHFLHLVPTSLTRYFNFDGFIKDISSKIDYKRINEEKINLKDIINTHIKKQPYEDAMTEIETTCRSILYLHFPVEVEINDIILPANAYKTIPVIVEETLRTNGSPMSLDELYEEITYQYPERNILKASIRSATTLNKNIIPIGRSSIYALIDWHTNTHRGGTIRQFVSEYLDSLAMPIAPANDIYAYVRKFRPGATDSSISSNLLQESHHRYIALSKNGTRYYGYSNIDYGQGYKAISGGSRPKKRTLQESMQLLEDFIVRNGRYPRNSETDEEERRLYRFVGNRRSICSRNAIPIKEISEWQTFEKKYRNSNNSGPSLFEDDPE